MEEQPIPSDAPSEYMRGYSDGVEWAKSQPISDEAIALAVDAWFDGGDGPDNIEPESINAFFETRMRNAINAALKARA